MPPTVRSDYVLNTKTQVFGRYSYQKFLRSGPGLFGELAGGAALPDQRADYWRGERLKRTRVTTPRLNSFRPNDPMTVFGATSSSPGTPGEWLLNDP